MVEQITPGLFRLEIPLPRNPLKAINNYLFITPERNLLIDTGMNLTECKEAMDQGLNELGVDLSRTDIFITHMHADHSGLITHLTRPGTRVYCSKPDAESLSKVYQWDERLKYARLNGFPTWEDAVSQHPDFNYRTIPFESITLVKDGDIIPVPGWQLQCLFTPGHSKGHMCLYDLDRKWLFSGDHVLGGITPNIGLFLDEEWDPLRHYLNNLEKVAEMDVVLTFPGHRRTIANLKQRLNELLQHHEKRCNDILTALQNKSLTAYEIAGKIPWDLSYKRWEQFPKAQQWFAQGEVMSHLKYLEGDGKVQKELVEGLIRYQLG